MSTAPGILRLGPGLAASLNVSSKVMVTTFATVGGEVNGPPTGKQVEILVQRQIPELFTSQKQPRNIFMSSSESTLRQAPFFRLDRVMIAEDEIHKLVRIHSLRPSPGYRPCL